MSKEIFILKLPFKIISEALKYDVDGDGKLSLNAKDKNGKTVNEIRLFGESMLVKEE